MIQPSELKCSDPGWQDWYNSCVQAEDSYLEMLAKGAKPQTARSVLPTCLATEIAWTANLREWRHICDLRGSAAAHPDIRIIIEQIKPHLREIAPTVFEDIN